MPPEEIDQAFMFEEIVGSSPALQAVLSSIVMVAPTDSTVLITGETGTGKELIARAIHMRSGAPVDPDPQGAAARLGIPRATLESKIKQLKIAKHKFTNLRD